MGPRLRRPGHSPRRRGELSSGIQCCDFEERGPGLGPSLQGGASCSRSFRNAPFPGPPPPRAASSLSLLGAKLWPARGDCQPPRQSRTVRGRQRLEIHLSWTEETIFGELQTENQVLSDFLGCAPIIPCKMRMFAFSLKCNELLDTVTASEDIGPIACLRETGERIKAKRSCERNYRFTQGASSVRFLCVPKWEGKFMKLLPVPSLYWNVFI